MCYVCLYTLSLSLSLHSGDEGGAPQGMEDGAPYSYGANMVGHTDDGIGYYMNRRYGDFEWTDEKFLAVDAHVLATPAMGDINKDGHMEVINVNLFL